MFSLLAQFPLPRGSGGEATDSWGFITGALVLLSLLAIMIHVIFGISCLRRRNYFLWWLTSIVVAGVVASYMIKYLDDHKIYTRKFDQAAQKYAPPELNSAAINTRKAIKIGALVAWFTTLLLFYPRTWKSSISGLVAWLVVVAPCGTYFSYHLTNYNAWENRKNQAFAESQRLREKGIFSAVSYNKGEIYAIDAQYATQKLKISSVISHRGIEELRIPRGVADMDELVWIAAFTKLKRLVLGQAVVEQPHVDAISGLVELQELTLSHCRIESVDVSVLKHCRQLATLGLSGTRISHEQAMQLAEIEPLTAIDVARSGIKEDDLRLILKLPKLRTLILQKKEISPESLERLRADFPKCAIEVF